MDALATVFEYYTQSLNQEKNNFISSKIWDEINVSLSRLYKRNESINSILSESINSTLSTRKAEKSHILPLEKRNSSYINLNESFLKSKILDVIGIKFIKFYPNIILKLCEEGIFNIDINLEFFNYLVKNYSYIKDILSHDGKICLNLYINYFFGKLEREKRDTVTGRGYLITEHFTNYPGWIYSDTDEIYIKDSIGIIKKVEEYLNIIEMPYEIKYYKEMLLLDPKKYITIDEFSIGKIYGFRVKNQ